MARKNQVFLVPTAECLVAPAQPYLFKVLRSHRDAGYYECVCLSGGHPANHGSIQIFRGSRIDQHLMAA